MGKHLRNKFSVVVVDGNYRIQCDDTLELVSGKIRTKHLAQKRLEEHVLTINFVETLKDMSVETIKKRVKLFNGRLRPVQKPWTIEEARLVAKIYKTRGELYNKGKNVYLVAYQRGWLNDICAHMTPSNKKNKFTYGVLNPNKALAKIFDYSSHLEFCKANHSAYDALRRFGVNTVELFENRDSAQYLQGVIKQLAQDQIEKFVLEGNES